MTRAFRKILLGLAGLTLFCGASATGAQAGSAGRYGIGFFVDYLVPVSAFSTWHKSAPQFGANLIYRLDTARPMALEFEYHYTRFNHGKVETKSFIWGVDQKSYTSPNARSRMTMNAALVNTIIFLGKPHEGKKTTTYLAVGTGFYNYLNRTENLIYPGQKATPLNPALVLENQEDASTAFGASMGVGAEIKVSPTVGLDLRGKYHMVFGHLNPMEAWGVKEVFPIQIADVRVALRFYFK